MRSICKLALMACAAAAMLSLGAGSALAARSIELSVAEGELGRVRTSGVVTMTNESGEFSIICEITNTITLNRAIAKRSGATVGLITAVSATGCRGGSGRVLAETLPWPITYVSFGGTLPNITEIRLQSNGVDALAEAFFGTARCLYRGNTQSITRGNPVTELRKDERVAVPLSSEVLSGVACPASVIGRATLRVTPTVRLRLI